MRTGALLVLLMAAVCSPCLAATQVNVRQLEGLLAEDSGKPDAEISHQLSDLDLSERLSTASLVNLQARLPGLKSRQALLVLADLSAFLPPPAADKPARPAPDSAEQRRILSHTVDYVLRTIHQLPNLSSTRVTSTFQSTPWQPEKAQSVSRDHQALHPVGAYKASISYRDGNEVVHAGAAGSGHSVLGLTTSGEFGPILNTALLDAARGKLAWSHWEGSAGALQAVFHYTVPPDKSHYEVKYCCIWRQNGDRVYFQQFTGYQGDIAVDPSNGTIFRLTLMADLKPTDPLVKAGILVEYGPVIIGGRSYICPTRSVALSVGLEIRTIEQGSVNSLGLLQTSLNDSAFEQYHVFRAEARILSAGARPPDGPASTGSFTDPVPEAATVAVAEHLARQPGPALPTEAANTPAPEESPAASRTLAPGVAEISVGAPATVSPGVSSIPASVARPQRPFHNPRPLIDVAVVASDQQGRPVVGLTARDFEIYDNNRRQVTEFVNDGTEHLLQQAGTSPEPHSFTNRPSSARGANAEAVDSHLTILLMDPANLSWDDFTYARNELMHALPTLPADERVALYVIRGNAFQVLLEGTNNRASLAFKLRGWLPNAGDFALAQQAEERERQSSTTTDDSSDPQHGNQAGGNAGSPGSAKPVLRDVPDSPGPKGQALAVLTRVARSLAATSGHKTVVWVTGKNLLAGSWAKAAGNSIGSASAESLLLRAEQALNYAHISLYPLETARLGQQALGTIQQTQDVAIASGASETQAGHINTGPSNSPMRGNTEPAAGGLRQIATATGGRVLRSGAGVSTEIQAVVRDNRAMYLLSFTPDTLPDDQYHSLRIGLVSHRGVTLRYRSGYQYAATPATLQQRFREAIWQPANLEELALSATPVRSSGKIRLILNIATTGLALEMQDGRWMDKLDIFLIEHDQQGVHATVTGQTLSLALKAATLDELTHKGIPFEQAIPSPMAAASVRVLVVDENSGLMGSVTVPTNALATESVYGRP